METSGHDVLKSESSRLPCSFTLSFGPSVCRGGVGWGIERVVKFTAHSGGRGGRGLVRVGACVCVCRYVCMRGVCV